MSRGIAFVLDGVVAVLVCTVGYELAVGVLATVGIGHGELARVDGAYEYVLAIPVIFAVYCAGSWTLAGRTLGMALLGVRVMKVGGGSPGVLRSVVRALAYWVSAILMLGFAWIAFDRRRQGFHDKIAGTYVVYHWAGR